MTWKEWVPIALAVGQLIVWPIFLLVIDSRTAASLAAHNKDADAHPSSRDVAKLELKFETTVGKLEQKVEDVRRAVEHSTSSRDISIADLRLAIEKITPRRRLEEQ